MSGMRHSQSWSVFGGAKSQQVGKEWLQLFLGHEANVAAFLRSEISRCE
jgi:hypothetical protein